MSLLNLPDMKLDRASKRSFPLELINVIRRQAEDLLLSNKDSEKGRAALRFVLTLLKERSGLEEMKKGESVLIIGLGELRECSLFICRGGDG